MQNVDQLITLIRDRSIIEALRMLEGAPELATAHSQEGGQLHGASPLHWAAHRNAAEVCERLIQLGADVNDIASDWWLTPLSWGADAASVDAVEQLLKHGADVNQDAIVGTSALHAVAMGGASQGKERAEAYAQTAEILIAHGADVNKLTNRRRTPLDEAIENENDRVAAVLRSHGGQVSAASGS